MGTGVYSDDNDFRVTRVGKLLRATSLDELPQIVECAGWRYVLHWAAPPLTYHPGAMMNTPKSRKGMFEVCPGLTGWAQVHGRREVEWNERIRLNIWYIDNMSLWLDIGIIFKTVFQVLKNENNAKYR
jgi:lipopolysaccharide/colanic/teichoic acid biosynthesis glycosyltransferase